MRIYMPICGVKVEKVRIMHGLGVEYGGYRAVFMGCIGEFSHTALFI
jgi:hypothetical protein